MLLKRAPNRTLREFLMLGLESLPTSATLDTCLFKEQIYALHSTGDMWQIDLWAKYEDKYLSDLWHDVEGWVLDCELCDLCGSWFPCAESINYPCLAPCPQLGHAGCGDLPQMRENRRHPNPRSDLPRPSDSRIWIHSDPLIKHKCNITVTL